MIRLIIILIALLALAMLIYYGISVVFRPKEKGNTILRVFDLILTLGAVALGVLLVSTLVTLANVNDLQLAMLSL